MANSRTSGLRMPPGSSDASRPRRSRAAMIADDVRRMSSCSCPRTSGASSTDRLAFCSSLAARLSLTSWMTSCRTCKVQSSASSARPFWRMMPCECAGEGGQGGGQGKRGRGVYCVCACVCVLLAPYAGREGRGLPSCPLTCESVPHGGPSDLQYNRVEAPTASHPLKL